MYTEEGLPTYLNFFSSFAFSATLLTSWEAVGGSLLAGLANGGLFVGCTRLIAALYFIGTEIEGMVVLAHSEYKSPRWHRTLLMWAVVLIPIVINIFARRMLAVIEVAAGIMHIVFMPVSVATMVILAPRNPNAFVWDNFVGSLTGWQNPGVVFSIGLLDVIAPLRVDGVIRMAEEVKNAQTVIPRPMIWGTAIKSIMAFSCIITVLYCAVQLDTQSSKSSIKPWGRNPLRTYGNGDATGMDRVAKQPRLRHSFHLVLCSR
ncbi:hypothetical protein EYZ11_011375 [Aspergillus tanneri]|uniref:Uncharacterized protein n=1 Tax=Aspergillus tanneri TaxID=1220188 RepID=A0A4V3UMZ1_9EURO|nr:hypothetical protein EYZ11_011375 [Aspergillus tanneri]